MWKILVKEIMTIQQKYVFIADYARNVAKCLKKQDIKMYICQYLYQKT